MGQVYTLDKAEYSPFPDRSAPLCQECRPDLGCRDDDVIIPIPLSQGGGVNAPPPCVSVITYFNKEEDESRSERRIFVERMKNVLFSVILALPLFIPAFAAHAESRDWFVQHYRQHRCIHACSC